MSDKVAHYVPLLHSRLCGDLDCAVIWDMRLSRICPRCGFALGLPISKYLNRPASRAVDRPDPRRERA